MNRFLKAIFMILILFLAGCTFNSKLEKFEVSKPIDETKYDDLVFRLVSEKEEYKAGEEINLYGEIEYLGEKDEVKIPMSSIFFSIKEMVREYEIKYRRSEKIAEQGVLTTTTLKKGEPYRVEYERKASYSPENDTDSYERFMKRFVNYGFPPGYYVVNGYTEILIGSNENPEKVNLEAKIDFKVIE